jgi:hypothetical protein
LLIGAGFFHSDKDKPSVRAGWKAADLNEEAANRHDYFQNIWRYFYFQIYMWQELARFS